MDSASSRLWMKLYFKTLHPLLPILKHPYRPIFSHRAIESNPSPPLVFLIDFYLPKKVLELKEEGRSWSVPEVEVDPKSTMWKASKQVI